MNSGDGSIEQYTPRYGVEALLPFIEKHKGKTIWLPFDTADSQIYQVLRANGHKIIATHIETGQDFFEYEPPHFDMILSNPPYKNKQDFIDRAMSFGKPWCLLLPVNVLSDIKFIENTDSERLQMLIPNKRMGFYHEKNGFRNSPTFKAVWFAYDVFDKPIQYCEIDKTAPNGFEHLPNGDLMAIRREGWRRGARKRVEANPEHYKNMKAAREALHNETANE